MFIDTHAHVNFDVFKNDADQVIRNALDENVWMIIVGTNYKTSKKALEYANRYEKGVFASIGLHPIHSNSVKAEGEDYNFVSKSEEFNYDVYEKLASFEKVVAIGEIGLDYYHIDSTVDVQAVKQKQKKTFWDQIVLARRLDLPVIIHCRQAHDDMIEIIRDFKKEHKDLIPQDRPWGVMHCFSGNEDLAWQYFNFGLIVSFTGLVTFSSQWDDLIRKLPNDKFMIETDCPFMTPEPFRGKRNEPVLVKNTANHIAKVKNIDVKKVEEFTTENAKKLFNL